VGVTTGARMRLAITDIARSLAISQRRTIPHPATENKGLEVVPLHKRRRLQDPPRIWIDARRFRTCD
jgi:hypothetical protein